MQKALLWKSAQDGHVHCGLCSQYCRIAPGERGYCGVRENRDGVLYTFVADLVAALNLDPVEKKPLFHFYPGTYSLSLGTMGCNLSCAFCQNHTLSQSPREGYPIQGRDMTPREIVDIALHNKAHSISYTYSEPTIFFELMLPTARLAKEEGIKNIIVSNGFQSPACLEELGPYIDAANIDLKSYQDVFYRDYCHARLKPVLQNLEHIRRLGWWLEVTTLVIPDANDSYDELAAIALFIKEKLGAATPWHVSRFHPCHRMTDRPPTPVETLDRAWQIGRDAGLEYIYIGNVPGHDGNNTVCPNGCGTLVTRRGFHVEKGSPVCNVCGAKLPGVGLETLKK